MTQTELKTAIIELQSALRQSILETHEARAERDRLKAAIRAYVNASNNDDTAGDTWGELLRVVGYDCE